MYLLLPCIFILSFLLSYYFKQYAFKKGLLDNPNYRSAHTVPTPLSGGIIFILLWFVFAVILTSLNKWSLQQALALLPAVLLITVVSFVDDKINLKAKWRFLVHFLSAVYFIWLLGGLPFITIGNYILYVPWLFSGLAILGLIWSTNLFNFMDGSDGFAALEAIFIFLIGGLLLYINYHAVDLAYLCFALVAVIMGFLWWNWPKAKIFMGDVGSAPLGFLILAIAILAQKFYGMSLLLWMMLYGLFIFDATITLIRRILAGEKWYEAHRNHAYQRLNKAGWSHQKILLAALGCNVLILVLVILASLFSKLMPLFIFIELLLLIFIYYRVEKVFPQKV